MLHGLAAVGKKAFEITRCTHDRATTNHSPGHRPRASKGIKYWTLFCMTVFILACYGVLVYQLYVWQVRDAESYRAEAVTQQLKDTTLPAVRGSIYSANGKLLAKSSTVWNIVADPSSVLKSGATEDQIRTAAEHIAELLDDGTTADTVYKALTASNKDTGEPYQYRVVKKGVEKPVADAILAYADSYRLKDGAVVVDEGINRVDGKLCGDVDFGPVSQKASYITPVPGGVGKMTIAMLMDNTVAAAEKAAAAL